MSYGLGSENQNLPAFVVLTSRGKGNSQGLYSKLWSSGFLDSKHQGVLLRSGKDPVLYLNDPDGISRGDKRIMLDHIAGLNNEHYQQMHDEEIQSRIAQYEMGFKMQSSVPELADLSDCDLVIEAVFEDRELKAQVTQEAQAQVPTSAILASNTSTLPITGRYGRPSASAT